VGRKHRRETILEDHAFYPTEPLFPNMSAEIFGMDSSNI
jgi:hypothetical protein